jgi:hypothetical protein
MRSFESAMLRIVAEWEPPSYPTPAALYHVSPANRGESIAARGLDPGEGLDNPGQVWLYTDEGRAKAHAGGRSHVWQVNPQGLDLNWNSPWGEHACYVTHPVPPENLTLLHQGREDSP